MTAVRLFVGTRKGVFVLDSTRERAEWTISGPFLKGWEVNNVAVDTRGDQPTAFAAVGHFVYGPTIHRSRDLGETWEQVDHSPTYRDDEAGELNRIWTIVGGRENEPDTLYAGVDEAGLFRTTDGGDTWYETGGLRDHPTYDNWFPGNGGLCTHSIYLHPTNPDRIWLGISAVGVLRTDDGGATWTLQNDGLTIAVPDDEYDNIGTCVHRLHLDPANPDRLYQQNHAGVYRSDDAGDHWTDITGNLPSKFGFPLAVHPHETDIIYTIPLDSDEHRLMRNGRPAVYRSPDAGDSWTRQDEGLPSNAWTTILRHGLAVDTLDPVGVYAGTTSGDIYQSADGGDTWQVLPCSLQRITSVTAHVTD